MGLALPHVELLVSLTTLLRLNMKDKLLRFRTIHEDVAGCPFCNLEVESIDHLFHYKFTPKVQSSVLAWWGIARCNPFYVKSLFEAWIGVKLFGLKKKMWCHLFFVIIWSIQHARNQKSFQNKEVDQEQLIFLVKLRLEYQ